MVSHPITLLAAITLCFAPFACDVDDTAHEPTSDKTALLEESEEITDLALASYVECHDQHPEACTDEEEDLVEAVRDLELAHGDNDFRAAAWASCTGKQPVYCSAPGTCTGTDDVGCVCVNNGALTAAQSCAQSPPLAPGGGGGGGGSCDGHICTIEP